MAAHVLTALQDIANLQSTVDQVRDALDYAAWADQLDFHDYCELADCVNMKQLEIVATRLYWQYRHNWIAAGKPDTYEQWVININKLEKENG